MIEFIQTLKVLKKKLEVIRGYRVLSPLEVIGPVTYDVFLKYRHRFCKSVYYDNIFQ